MHSALAVWGLFISDEMIDNIIENTKAEANQMYERWNAAHPDQEPRRFIGQGRIGMKTFLGLL